MSWKIRFYETARGDKPIEEFLLRLGNKERAKCLDYFDRLAEHGNSLPGNYIKYLQGGLWELRPEFGGVEFRFFYFIVTAAGEIVILHAFKKKTQKTPERDLSLALKRMAETKESE